MKRKEKKGKIDNGSGNIGKPENRQRRRKRRFPLVSGRLRPFKAFAENAGRDTQPYRLQGMARLFAELPLRKGRRVTVKETLIWDSALCGTRHRSQESAYSIATDATRISGTR